MYESGVRPRVDFYQKAQITLRPRWIFIKKLKLLSDLGGFSSKSSNYSRTQVDFHQKAQITLGPRVDFYQKVESVVGGS